MSRILPAVIVVIVANAASLAFVAANRAGEPDAMLTVTERELRLAHASDRDSAQRLDLDVRAGNRWLIQSSTGELAWLTVEKLAALGFDCRPPRATTVSDLQWSGSCGLARRAFVAIEYEGSAWSRIADALRRERDKTLQTVDRNESATAAARSIDQQIRYGSRLVAVDASLDADSLRRMYADRRRFMILPATISAWISVDRRKDPSARPDVGADVRVLTTSLIAPVRYRDRLVRLGPSPYGTLENEPRYSVTLIVGRRHEPWIQSIDPIDTSLPR